MKSALLLPLLYLTTTTSAQSYTDTIQQHRSAYRTEFVTNEHSPLSAQDTPYLRFYPPNPQYRTTATLKTTPKATPFQMPTHSGKAKTYRKYAVLT
ncbi:MAG TPA: hypothetical protein PL009_14650, partial [Flavipsychrobacter sp.]|nr:hypothetical protein [Flavipsychrobacter sp.]